MGDRIGTGYGNIELQRSKPMGRAEFREPQQIRKHSEQMDRGLMTDLSTYKIPLEASPFMRDVRFEQGGVRKDFGWEVMGAAAAGEVIALGLYEWIHPTTDVVTERVYRIYLNGTSNPVFEYFDEGTGSWTGAQTAPTAYVGGLVHPQSIVGYLCFADGARIFAYNEGADLEEDEYDATAGNTIVTEWDGVAPAPADSNEQITISNTPIEKELDWHYSLDIKHGFGYLVVKIDGSIGATWVEMASKTYMVAGAEQYPDEVLTIEPVAGLWPTDMRIRVGRVVNWFDVFGTGISSTDFTLHSFNKATDGDPYASLEFHYWGPVTTTFDEIGGDSPAADYVFSFEDRLISLGGEDDPQRIAGSIDGDPRKWNIRGDDLEFTGAFSLSVLDTEVTEPLEAMVAGAKVANNVAAIFRETSILRMQETNNLKLPVQVQDWVSGIGTRSPLSVTNVPGGVCFLGHDRMPYYLEGGGPKPMGQGVSQQIQEDLEGADLADVEAKYDSKFKEWYLGIPDANGWIQKWYIFSIDRLLSTQEVVWRVRHRVGLGVGDAELDCDVPSPTPDDTGTPDPGGGTGEPEPLGPDDPSNPISSCEPYKNELMIFVDTDIDRERVSYVSSGGSLNSLPPPGSGTGRKIVPGSGFIRYDLDVTTTYRVWIRDFNDAGEVENIWWVECSTQGNHNLPNFSFDHDNCDYLIFEENPVGSGKYDYSMNFYKFSMVFHNDFSGRIEIDYRIDGGVLQTKNQTGDAGTHQIATSGGGGDSIPYENILDCADHTHTFVVERTEWTFNGTGLGDITLPNYAIIQDGYEPKPPE